MEARKKALEKLKAAGRPPPIPQQASTVTAISTTTQSPSASAAKKNGREIDLNYCEYDLRTMHDTKAGFMVDEDAQALKKQKTENKPMKEPLFDNSGFRETFECSECLSLDVDVNYQRYYGVIVCRECRDKYTEKYSLLTKTECKSVENFANEKWGSLENLDKEFERREDEKKAKKELLFKKKLLGLDKESSATYANLRIEEKDTNKYFPSRIIGEDLKKLASRDQLSAKFSSTGSNSNLAPFLVPRTPGSPGSRKVQKYLIRTFKALNWTIEQDSFEAETPKGKWPFNNIIATKDPNAPRRIVLAAHYDSKLFTDFDFIGATDSAVPCAILVDIAKTLDAYLNSQSKGKTPSTTLQLIFFDGEEAVIQWTATDSIYGSRHLAKRWQNRKVIHADGSFSNYLESIELFVLLDLLGTPEVKLLNLQEQTTWAWNRLVDIESRLAQLNLLSSNHITAMGTGESGYFVPGGSPFVGGIEDDHKPFLDRGVPVVHVIPASFPSVWHTAADNAAAVDAEVIQDFSSIFRVFTAEYLGLL
ncbi:hypothetical protein HDU97_008127 [Phlyctochytrium planicorne]|nr:hypothetical protein HDU97_008127 [Phlyctochytrium planicorne]